ncbi:LAS superfamily LD-carboxypeptidase LdcB [Neolewinella xylanilytica]|uniref:LAS superfamily LD-carboxypeptidase LdcB n=1 Tax=Neolewinella xylanilytica TaxID=1514080 RepID=A0A2S6IAY1_9BACT|nr:M15 family metallopeptidase [Neolewinella xylanilytica]PPK88660.1 LAS superfamily LD-carboxypeptidase LdcB [Neolewinella xylanilytica]
MRYFLLLLLCFPLFSCSESGETGGERVASPSGNVDSLAPAPRRPLTDSIAGLPVYTYLTGKFDPAVNEAFVRVADTYTDGDPYLLHEATYAAFQRMHAAALEDGVRLRIVSATRNFDRQKQIWEAKWNGQRLLEGTEKADEVYPDPADRARAILRYSSMPGTSRHHWGTDIDLNALNNGYFDEGEGKQVYDWLTAHAADYGFCQPYTAKGSERPNGYEEERWHWSYLPLATQLTDYAAEALADADISGFAGAEAAPRIEVVKNYVLGVNPRCKE